MVTDFETIHQTRCFSKKEMRQKDTSTRLHSVDGDIRVFKLCVVSTKKNVMKKCCLPLTFSTCLLTCQTRFTWLTPLPYCPAQWSLWTAGVL